MSDERMTVVDARKMLQLTDWQLWRREKQMDNVFNFSKEKVVETVKKMAED